MVTVGDLREEEVRPFVRFWRSGGGTTRSNATVPPLPHFLDAPDALAAAYARVGGYIPDLQRVVDATALSEVADASPVAALAAAPDAFLAAHALAPQHVTAVFEAIITRGVSARGGVALGSLLERVPQAQLRAMETANLVEVRRYGVAGGVDYDELRALAPGAYVCAPCPLARESMAAVVSMLRAAPRAGSSAAAEQATT